MKAIRSLLIARSPLATLTRLGLAAVLLALGAVGAWVVAEGGGGPSAQTLSAQGAAPRPTAAGVAFAATLIIRPADRAPIFTLNSEGLVNNSGEFTATIRTPGRTSATRLVGVGESLYIADTASGSDVTSYGRADLATLFVPPLRDSKSVPVCRASSGGVGKILSDPFGAVSATGRMTVAGSETLDGVAVVRHTGNSNVGQLSATLAAFVGADASCVGFLSAITAALSGYANANTIPMTAQVWLGEKDSFPYRIRIEVANIRFAQMDVDVRLTPREIATQINAPR